MDFQTRRAELSDAQRIYKLYKKVAAVSGAIARSFEEITHDYIDANLQNSLNTGVSLVIEEPGNPQVIIGEIHCYKLKPRVFDHILSELTIVVAPDFQGLGVGKCLFSTLLDFVKRQRPDILRIELIARESNLRAIEFYKRLGFQIEGRLEKRIKSPKGEFEADIPMAWFNKNFVG